MAEFLDTQGVSYYLKKLIDNSDDKLYLISPYLQLNNQLKLSLEDRHKFSIDIVMIYGKVSEINPADSEWLTSMPGIKLMFHKDLHAKCYFNGKEAIITSMNLYMFSQQNNVEMGIYVSKKDDEKLYNQIAKEVDRIKRGSEHRTISVKKVEKIIPEPKIEKETPKTEAKKDYSKSKLLTTKEISQATGLSSRKVNAWLTDNKLMYKKDDDWFATKKGNEVGATQKSGSYGKFIVWPEEITVEVKE
jgi:phosphatidylserine/phosphatidylglycerophosphate/cardiolipin synthase-like enzyme